MVTALVVLIHSAVFARDLLYEVRSNQDSSTLCVTIAKKTDGVTYRSTFRGVTQLYHYKADHYLTIWEYADSGNNSDFKADRNGSEIRIRGRLNGRPLDKSLVVGQQVWMQNSEFGLLEFLQSTEKSKDFIVVTPEDLSVIKVRATRSTAEVVWEGQQMTVVVLTARLRGFLSFFWEATYWYRVPDLTFLRYSADGLPGFPKVEILLVQESE